MDYVYDKDDFYSKLDLFCFTSYIEDIAFIVPEAISYKIPIIDSSIGFVSDILDDGDLIIIPNDNIDNPEKLYKKGRCIKV